MKTLARIASVLIAASLASVPIAAMADQKPSETRLLEASSHKGSPQRDKPAFPMKAEEFRKMVEKRIEHIKTHIERSMSKHSLPAPQRAEVNKAVDTAVKEVHGAVDKVAADGVVTRDEAKQVKAIADQLRDKMREQFKEKGPRAKAPKAKAKPKSA
jgi:hypothetical protein